MDYQWWLPVHKTLTIKSLSFLVLVILLETETAKCNEKDKNKKRLTTSSKAIFPFNAKPANCRRISARRFSPSEDRKYVCSSQASQRQVPQPVADARRVTAKMESRERVGTKDLI